MEIIVVDGGSTDDTFDIVSDLGAIVLQSKKGRAKQMNYGASQAKGKILYFLHADTFPPKNFDNYLLRAVTNETRQVVFECNSILRTSFFPFFHGSHESTIKSVEAVINRSLLPQLIPRDEGI